MLRCSPDVKRSLGFIVITASSIYESVRKHKENAVDRVYIGKNVGDKVLFEGEDCTIVEIK